jgi:uncharacterized membrane protein (DUF485 family)
VSPELIIFLLSRGFRLLCHLFLALLLSVISFLIYKGVELVGAFPGGVRSVDFHAASCIRHVKECTASSISSGCFSLMLSFILSTIWVRKAFQSVLCVISLGALACRVRECYVL